MIEIYAEKYEKELKTAAEAVCRKLNVSPEDVDVEINIADEEEIRELNREERGVDKVTDVLSFQNLADVSLPFNKEDYVEDINPEDGAVFLGEIFVCLKRAVEQAEEYGHSVEREVSFLTCHGMLHLFGYDHDTEEKEKVMNGLCEETLDSIGQTREKPFSMPEEEKEGDFRSGFVAVMGRPNAGKSTLINAIVGEKVSIVSWKPQTTRNKIKGIYNEKDCQIVFIDTPGLHAPRNALGEYMMKSAESAVEGIDCIVYVIDGEKGYLDSDKENIAGYVKAGCKVIVVVNKVDHVTKDKVMGILTELSSLTSIEAVVPLSALRNRNVAPLIEEIKKLLTDTVKYYDEESYTDKNMRFMTAEIIREKALRLLDKEVPYGIGVDVREYRIREKGDIIDINADIICEKQAHKPIILGKDGSMIKKIATYARQDLEQIAGMRIFLTLFVRVKDDWRQDESVMREIGYNKKDID